MNRYYTKNKANAFSYANKLNKEENKDIKECWRVVTRVKNRIIFDLDTDDLNNARFIKDSYAPLFGELMIYKSNTGFHIYSKRKYTNEWDWHYDTCRVLNPLLETKHILRYLGNINDWYQKLIRAEFEEKWDRLRYLEEIKKQFPDSGLYCGYGDFDILFALMVILKGYYCIRISKKSENDKTYEVL